MPEKVEVQSRLKKNWPVLEKVVRLLVFYIRTHALCQWHLNISHK